MGWGITATTWQSAKEEENMKTMAILITILSLVVSLSAQKLKQVTVPDGKYLQYEVEAFDAQAWIVTAHEVVSGKRFRFRLPPKIFEGQTFSLESEAEKPGQPFVVRGPKNARLGNLVMGQHLPMARVEAEKGKSLSHPPATPGVMAGMQPLRLAWVIVSLDPQNFVITARNEKTRRTIRFKVNPQCFTGVRFLANTADLASGMAFSIIIPNEEAFNGCCTLME